MRCSKRYAACAVFFLILQPAVLFAGTLQPNRAHPHQRVYLLRGFMNVFSLGMDQLADELRHRGIEAVVANHTLSGLYANEAIRDCKAGSISSIAIVGHSLGATAAVDMAEQLGQAGVAVGLVVTVDPITTTAAPRNVKRLENFYISDGVGKTVQRGPDFRGSLQNIDVKSDASIGHVSIANSEHVHQLVMRSVAEAATSRCK
jgi:pimeloyl-ACP methyl ester carboxylesterase